MRSPQIVRLQQQFLASLHSEPRSWLLDQIIPAPAFRDSQEVLKIYLHRAMARTVDPLNQVFHSVRWMMGAEHFEELLERFYADSLGEPLNAEALSTEFVSYLGSLEEEDWVRMADRVSLNSACGFTASMALVAAALLDWRCHWVSLIAHRSYESTELLQKKLHQRSSIWQRPTLNPTSKQCVSGVDLVSLNEWVEQNVDPKEVPYTANGPATFLIYADQDHKPKVRLLNSDEARLINHCDGTHTIASLCHEAEYFGRSHQQTRELISALINDGVIRGLNDGLN